jgi:hypothetical protein
MPPEKKIRKNKEFGDFQTPLDLAREVCLLLAQRGIRPKSLLEPTCGLGGFIVAALEHFSTVTRAVGIEINSVHVKIARREVAKTGKDHLTEIRQADFFRVDWGEVMSSLTDPLLIIGNPPWVTNSELGTMGSSNVPAKSNFQNHRGIDSITGKGNFDISEWMLLKSLEWIKERRAVLAMLCKTAVARKVLVHAWKNSYRLDLADVHLLDTAKYFGAQVDACLLVVEPSPLGSHRSCRVHDTIRDGRITALWGYRDGDLAADVKAYETWRHLAGREHYTWRSGIKHDCVKVMEFRDEEEGLRNGLGQLVHLESDYVYPLLKSADVAKGPAMVRGRCMLVTQRNVGDDTETIREKAPKTWEYLQEHRGLLDRRASSIYRGRPRFSVFGVGEYSFAQWKVAISGLYKTIVFRVVGPFNGKPTVLDDTCYFVACHTKREAVLLSFVLNSEQAREFFGAFIFWDAKRPITATILRRLDLLALARELGVEEELLKHRR